jgi:hypothetical protein
MKIDGVETMLLSLLVDYFSLRKYALCYIKARVSLFQSFSKA